MDILITDVIPHRDRMLLLDEVVFVDANSSSAIATVTERWPLNENNQVSPLVLVEVLAQTAAICAGYEEYKSGQNVKDGMGWLVSIKSVNFEIETLDIGSKIETTATKAFVFDNFLTFTAIAKINGSQVCDISMQVLKSDS